MHSSTTGVIGARLIMVRGCSGSDDGGRWVGFGGVGFLVDYSMGMRSRRSCRLELVLLFFHHGASLSLWNYL